MSNRTRQTISESCKKAGVTLIGAATLTLYAFPSSTKGWIGLALGVVLVAIGNIAKPPQAKGIIAMDNVTILSLVSRYAAWLFLGVAIAIAYHQLF